MSLHARVRLRTTAIMHTSSEEGPRIHPHHPHQIFITHTTRTADAHSPIPHKSASKSIKHGREGMEKITKNIWRIAGTKSRPNCFVLNQKVAVDPHSDILPVLTNLDIEAIGFTHSPHAHLDSLGSIGKQLADLNKFGVQVVPTPGHTPDSVSFYSIQDEAMCVGNAIYCQPINSSLDVQPLRSQIYTDSQVYLQSLSKIQNQFPKWILPAHGNILTPLDVLSTLDRAMEGPALFERLVLKQLKKLGTRGQLIKAKDVITNIQALESDDSPLIVGMVCQELVRLETLGRIARACEPPQDASKIYGPGGLSMDQIFNLVQDRKAKDALHYPIPPKPTSPQKQTLGVFSKIHPSHMDVEDVRNITYDLLIQ